MFYFLLGLLVLGLLLLSSHWYARANSHDLAQGARAFAAVFSGLAGTGLLLTGRFGLALITLSATVMAIRAIRRARRGADPLPGGPDQGPVEIATELLAMRLDRTTGDVDGAVRQGRFAGRDLADLELGQLLDLLAEAAATDPRSTSLLEAYLDRRFPDWRVAGDHGSTTPPTGGMDEQQALDILGLAKGAAPDEIRKAHRRLMARLHPDSGGSNFLAAQINRAKEVLLGETEGRRR